MVEGRRRQQEAVPLRLGAVLAQGLEIPQLADGEAEAVEEVSVQDCRLVSPVLPRRYINSTLVIKAYWEMVSQHHRIKTDKTVGAV